MLTQAGSSIFKLTCVRLFRLGLPILLQRGDGRQGRYQPGRDLSIDAPGDRALAELEKRLSCIV